MVSIIIPTYKGSSGLSRAIDSVLKQSYKDFEVIVVDDNIPESEERHKTEVVMMRYEADLRIRYLKHVQNLNGAAARNTGIAAANGEYIAFLDDDDYYLPERIQKSVSFLANNADAIGVYVGVDVVDEDGIIDLKVRPNSDLRIHDLLLNDTTIGTGSNIFVKSEVARKIGGFDANFLRRQDIEFMIRICHEGRVGYISEKLIIKSFNGTINFPKYTKMKETIALFERKFKEDIDGLGYERKAYRVAQYRTLYDIALYNRNAEEIIEAMHVVEQNDKLTLKDRMLKVIYIHNLRDTVMVKKLIKIWRYLNSKIKCG